MHLPPRNILSRRDILKGLGALSAWALTGCESPTADRITGLSNPQSARAPIDFPPASGNQPAHLPQPANANSPYSVYPRSAWTSAGPDMSKITPMEGVRRITFHHSGDQRNDQDIPFLGETPQETIAHLEMVREYHTQDRGWADIGYHFAIDRAGRVWQLRSAKFQGAHVARQDEHNLGIVVLGNFNIQQPTAAQKQRIQSFGRLSRAQYDVSISRIYTHQELGKTDCPGTGMQPFMVAVRRQGLI